MRVCLLNTPSLKKRPVSRSMAGGLGFDSSEAMILPPIDLAILASRLRETGHQVDMIDADPLDYDVKDILNYLNGKTYDWIIATTSLPTLKNDSSFIASLRKICKVAVKTSIRDTEILKRVLNESNADIIIHDECDLHIEQILEGISDKGIAFLRDGELLIKDAGPIKDMDKIPFAARDLLPNERYTYPLLGEGVTTLQTSRGCPFACSYYCPYPLVEGKVWRAQSAERVYAEIESIVNRLGIHKILFRDATFTLNKERVHSICNLIIKNRLSVKWWCETRVDCLDAALLEKMRLAGCLGMNIGVETGDEALMSLQAKKGLNLEKLRWLRNEAKRIGLKLHFLLSIGMPQETKKSIIETYDLIQRFKPESLGITVITPYPCTPLYTEAVKNGWIESCNWEDYGGHQVVMHTDNLSSDDIAAALNFLRRGYDLLRRERIEGVDCVTAAKEESYRELLLWACDLSQIQRFSFNRYVKGYSYRLYNYTRQLMPSYIKDILRPIKIYIRKKIL